MKPPRSRFEPGNRLPWDVTVLFKTHTIFLFTFFVGKSTFVPLTLLIPVLGSPLSNRFCRCAGDRITEWMSGGQQSNWCLWRKRYPRDHFGNIKATSRLCVCALVNIKWFDFSKRGCFFYPRFGVSSLSSPSLPSTPPPDSHLWLGGSLERPGTWRT